MALGNSNIDTDLVANAIGVASHDVFTLCTHNNINKGSKFKPGYLSVTLPYVSYVKPDGVQTNPLRNQIHDAYLDDFALYNHAAVVPGIQGKPSTMSLQVRNVGSNNTGYATPITMDIDLGELDWWEKETQVHGRIYYRTGGSAAWRQMRVRTTLGMTGIDNSICHSEWVPCSDASRKGTVTITPIIQPGFGSQNYWIVLELANIVNGRSIQLANKDLFRLIDVWIERVFDPGMWPTPHHDLAANSFNGKYAYDVDNNVLGVLSEVQDIRFKGDYSFTEGTYGEWRTTNFQIFFKAVFTPEGGTAYLPSEIQIMSTAYDFSYDLWQFLDIPGQSGKAEQVVLVNLPYKDVSSAYYGKGSLFFGNYTPGQGALPDGGSTVNGFPLTDTGCYVPNIKTFTSYESYNQGKGPIHGITILGVFSPGICKIYNFPFTQDKYVFDSDLTQVRPNATGFMDIKLSFDHQFTAAQQAEMIANNQTYKVEVRDSSLDWKEFCTVKNYNSDGSGYTWFEDHGYDMVFHCNVKSGVNFDGNEFEMRITYKGLN